MTRPRLLDLFCGAGGAARGYQLAGFHVVGVDLEPQPHYPADFVQADALTYPLDGFDAIHASPPCQLFSAYRRRGNGIGDGYLDLIAATRVRLVRAGVPYVIENVPGAPLRSYVQLCGTGFGLVVERHRWFEGNVPLVGVPCAHGRNAPRFTQATNRRNRRRTVEIGVWRIPLPVQQWAMEIDWMTREELSQAIPPAYTEFIGGLLLAHLSRAGARAADPGPPTSSSPAAARGAEAPDGMTTAPALGAQSEAEVARTARTGDPGNHVARLPAARELAPSASDSRPSQWRPAFVDNDARDVPTTRETVPIQEGVL